MMARRRSNADSGGGIAVVGVLFIIWVVVKFLWWIVAAGALVGLFFIGRMLLRHWDERRIAAEHEAEQLAYRADRQHQWARKGDSRGVYGPSGAELMRTVSPAPDLRPPEDAVPDGPVAAVAHTPGELSRLLTERPAEWRWAVFASVLVQRRAAVQSRLRDCELGFVTPSDIRAYSGNDVGAFVTARMGELSSLIDQVDAFVLAPAFMDVFGRDEGVADADGIVHVGHRLMDYHDRFLLLAESSRDYSVPAKFRGLQRDCTRLMNIPLDSYRTFIDDMVERVGEMPDLLRYTSGTIEADPVVLYIDIDDGLIARISKQLRLAAKA